MPSRPSAAYVGRALKHQPVERPCGVQSTLATGLFLRPRRGGQNPHALVDPPEGGADTDDSVSQGDARIHALAGQEPTVHLLVDVEPALEKTAVTCELGEGGFWRDEIAGRTP